MDLIELDSVKLTCINVNKRLRIRIVSPGYHKDANCQFPRNIRKEGRMYWCHPSAIKLSKGPRGKYFYRVSKSEISFNDIKDFNDIKVYGDDDTDECNICMGQKKNVVFAPCGHFCSCDKCAKQIKKGNGKCPMCRGKIDFIVNRKDIG